MAALICFHSTYIDSAFRDAAIRSAVCSSAPQAEHHARMSVSDGGVTPLAILDDLALCQPHRTASS